MSSLAFTVAQACYLFAPLLIASSCAGVVLRFNLFAALKRPLDGGAVVRGRRVFGDNKTWRGLVVPVAGCVLAVAIQKYVIGDRRPPQSKRSAGDPEARRMGASKPGP